MGINDIAMICAALFLMGFFTGQFYERFFNGEN